MDLIIIHTTNYSLNNYENFNNCNKSYFCVSINAQTTGVGIIAQIDPEFNFNETVVDSTSSVTITISNSVNSVQTISFDGLSSPFSISDDELNVLANGDGEITVFSLLKNLAYLVIPSFLLVMFLEAVLLYLAVKERL